MIHFFVNLAQYETNISSNKKGVADSKTTNLQINLQFFCAKRRGHKGYITIHLETICLFYYKHIYYTIYYNILIF